MLVMDFVALNFRKICYLLHALILINLKSSKNAEISLNGNLYTRQSVKF